MVLPAQGTIHFCNYLALSIMPTPETKSSKACCGAEVVIGVMAQPVPVLRRNFVSGDEDRFEAGITMVEGATFSSRAALPTCLDRG